MDIIKFNKIKYVSCDDIMSEAPVYSKGARNTRSLIKRKNIDENMYLFAREIDIGKWDITDGKSIKFDKIFIKKEYLINIPELSDNDELIVDDKGILKAPSIIHLNDNEKFKDDVGNIVDIETRGTRNCNDIYFLAKDVSRVFEMKSLCNTINDDRKGYKINTHYKKFICIKNDGGRKKTNKLMIFLTYKGMLKVLFNSITGKAELFVNWTTETLFTVQMGTTEQKEDLVSGIIGIPAKSLRQVLSTSSTNVPCIYRFAIGTCKNLRKTMNISKDIPDDHIIIKYGYTDNLVRRTKEHMKTYEAFKGVKLELMNYTYIDPKYLSNAEVDIKEFFEDIETPIKYKTFVELVAINPKHEKQIKKQFQFMSKEYAGNVKDLIDRIEELKRDNENIQKKYLNELELLKKQSDIDLLKKQSDIDLLKKQSDIDLLKKQSDIDLLKKDLELLNKDLEIEKMKNELLILKNK
jgi:hypothetical protein